MCCTRLCLAICIVLVAVLYAAFHDMMYFLLSISDMKPKRLLSDERLKEIAASFESLNTSYPISFSFVTIESSNKWTILYSHGIGDDLFDNYDIIKHVSNVLNCNIIYYDYNGYGTSTKLETTESTMKQNIFDVYDYLTQIRNISSDKIILWGASMGSVPTTHLLSKLLNENIKIGGLILQSPLKSFMAIVLNKYLKDRYYIDNIQMILKYLQLDLLMNDERIMEITDYNAPSLVIMGKMDAVIAFEDGKWFYDVIKNKNKNKISAYYWDTYADHIGDLKWIYNQKFKQNVLEFVTNIRDHT